MAFNFRELNLSGVDISSAPQILQPGRYVVTITDAFIKQTRNGGSAVELSLTDVKGQGTLRAWINVNVPSSQTATRIGREQLKALLIHGGHPTPDNPSDIASLKGLKVGASVQKDTYTMDGEERTGSKLKGFFDPSEIDPDTPKKSSPGTGMTQSVDDKDDAADEAIPF
tara:strand:- start:53 stop:559 length:507 start_codon:yes stop_codon:yes gene_type:complete